MTKVTPPRYRTRGSIRLSARVSSSRVGITQSGQMQKGTEKVRSAGALSLPHCFSSRSRMPFCRAGNETCFL